MPPKGKSPRHSKKSPPSTRAKKTSMPLFFQDAGATGNTLVQFVEKVMDDSGLVFKQKKTLARSIAAKLGDNGGKTLSAQQVLAMLADESEDAKRPVTADGLPMPAFSANARVVLNKRYLIKNAAGEPIEQPWEMLKRVAATIAAIDRQYDPQADVDALTRQFYEMMARLEFLPNSPTLMNAGRDLGQLSACFVLPVDDSMESIFEAIKHTALIHKSGGGTGFSFSRLRPKNDPVKTTKGVSSGPISFMTVFDAATDTIKQGGTRRGANMGILRVDHPDILDFITAKKDLDKLNNFNLSVALTNAFMEALKTGKEYALVNPHTGKEQGRLSARKVFDLIVQMAWLNGEPGLVFLDRLNESNPTPEVGAIEATNPCGEQPLLPYESCNLGSINLTRMVKGRDVDWDKLRKTIQLAVHFLDNVIDANQYPLKQIGEMTRANRKIGLGIMGFAEMLIQLDIAYDTQRGVDKGRQVMAFIQKEGRKASCALADQRGPFPNIDRSVYAKETAGNRPRNATVTTIAPTGTLSLLAGTSSGIEPLFALSFVRNVLDGAALVEMNPLFEKAMQASNVDDEKLLRLIAESGSVRNIPQVPETIRKVYCTAHDIDPISHVRMQAAFQKFTDNAVSKTVNFPQQAKPKHIAEAFLQAYELGCKGITIFRYGSRDPVLSLTETKTQKRAAKDKLVAQPIIYDKIHPRQRSRKLDGSTDLATIGCGKLYVTINYDNIGLCEVMTSTGRTGGCPSQSEAISRLVSLALRSGIAVEDITHQLEGIRCHSALRRNELITNGDRAVSCPAAIGQALLTCAAMLSKERKKSADKGPDLSAPVNLMHTQDELYWLEQGLCPDCQTAIEYEGGCVICRSCGFSKCG